MERVDKRMKKQNVLYQIKEFDKVMLRSFLQDSKEIMPLKTIPTPTQMQILKYLIEHLTEDIYQRDLEKALHLRRATISGVLKTMEKNHLIKRIITTEDARSKKIMINENAKIVFEKIYKNLLKLEKIMMDGIEEKELEMFLVTLEKMTKNLEKNIN